MRHLAASIVAGLLGLALLHAQRGQRPLPPPMPPPAQFRASIDLVHLDVSVLDRDRRPVRGLAPADFTILENGAPQHIAVFTAVEIASPDPPPAGWMRDVARDVRTNEGIEERRLFLLLLDDAAMQSDLRAVKNAREAARGVIERLGPSDLAAVVFTRDNRNSQDYTADRTRLLATVEKFTAGFRDMAHADIAGADDLYFMYSVGVIEQAIDVLSTLPDRRKSIVYIGQGIPVDLELLATPQSPGLPETGGASPLARQGSMARLQNSMRRAFDRAARANVNVYTLDACGLRTPPPPPPPAPTCVPGLEVDYLHTVAVNTRARAVVNTNDFGPGVQAIFDENSSYYLLGYQSADSRQDGRLRRIDVRVNRPGVEVRTRSGYQADRPDAAKRKAELAKSPLGAALAGVLPKSDLPLQMTAVPLPLPGRRESAIAMVVGVRQPIRPSAGRTIEKVDLQVSAFDVDGRPVGSRRLQADVAIRPGATGLAEYEVLTRLDLKPGRYQLRIAASVGSLATSGSLYYDVDVPDVSRAPVVLSALVLSVTPGPVVAPREGLRAILPVVPTSQRDFTARDRVTAFTRVLQGGKARLAAVPLRVQVQNHEGLVVLDRRQDLAVERFTTDRTADVQMEIPVGRLPPGEYLLTVETGSGQTSLRRDVRFRVR